MTDVCAGQGRGTAAASTGAGGSAAGPDTGDRRPNDDRSTGRFAPTSSAVDLPVWFDPDDDATPVRFLAPEEVARRFDVDEQPPPTGDPDRAPDTGDVGDVHELLRAYLDEIPDEEPERPEDVERLLAAYLADDG